MTRTVSSRYIRESQAQSSPEVLIYLARISHPTWAQDILLARNGEAVVHNSESYAPYPFDVALPEDEEAADPVMRFIVSNATLEIMAALRAVEGEVEVAITAVLASQPDVVEAGPIVAELQAAEGSAGAISGSLAVEPILDRSFSRLQVTPATTPGLF